MDKLVIEGQVIYESSRNKETAHVYDDKTGESLNDILLANKGSRVKVTIKVLD